MNRIRKIVISTESEIAGIVNTLALAYKKLGYDVVTIARKNQFHDFQYDINPSQIIYSYLKRKLGSEKLSRFCEKFLLLFGKKNTLRINSFLIKRILKDIDVYIYVYKCSFWPDEVLLPYLKSKNIKIVSLFLGSDIRDYPSFKEKFNISHWDFSEEINLPGTILKKNKLLLHEKWSDAVFSVPDQSIFASRSYFHLKVPMQLEKFSPLIPKNDIPVIIHAPSKPELKGTDLILNTLKELSSEGVKFELKLLKELTHEKLIQELKNADILVDEIVLHGPGFLSFEAMLCGCAVATKYYSDSPQCFKPPVFCIHEYNIKERLRLLINDKALIYKLAQDGVVYAKENNDSVKIAEEIIDSLYSSEFDYKI
jgi:hypothetical protein